MASTGTTTSDAGVGYGMPDMSARAPPRAPVRAGAAGTGGAARVHG
ncbi:hypothetical protein ACFWXK_17505 [Streptomyces sp. NPDC059070]